MTAAASERLPPVLYHDDRIVVVDKPTGLLSVPGIGPDKADCLAVRVAEAFEGARIVHRLDRDTSGVILLALDAEAHRALSIQFQDRVVEKKYIAVVAGVVQEEEGVIELPLRKAESLPPRHIVDHEQGRMATTRWRVLERGPDRTRLELRPITGRSHQLRVHLDVSGHPILGDDIYAPPELAAAAPRLLLHATTLSFVHPTDATWRTVTAEVPF